MRKIIDQIMLLSNTETIFSAEEMQQNLDKIHELAKELEYQITYVE